MQLKDVLAALNRFRLLSAVAVLVCVVGGALAVYLPATNFQATATLIAQPSTASPASSVPTVQFMLPAIVQQVETQDFRRAVLHSTPALAQVPDLSMTATQAAGTGIIYIVAKSRDKGMLAQAADAAATQLIGSRLFPLVQLQLLNPAADAQPVANDKIAVLAASFVLGLMAAVLVALGANALRKATVEEGDLESMFGLEILGEIPKENLRSPLIADVFTDRDHVNVSEAFQKLVANLQTAAILDSHREIAIVSCVGGEGKTTVSSGLAFALALTGHRTTLIDADLRRPTVHMRFGLGLSPGLGDATFKPSAQKTVMTNLQIVPAGQPYAHPTNIVTRRLPALLKADSGFGDIVLVDTPPLDPTPEATLISHFVSGVIFVIEPGRTDRRLLQRGLHDLRRSDVDVLGVVLNRVERGANKRYSDYYGITFPTPAHAEPATLHGTATVQRLERPARSQK